MKNGFYWVRFVPHKWEVAEYYGVENMFFVCGFEERHSLNHTVYDRKIVEIGPYLGTKPSMSGDQ
jgi:hypothetical protein